MIDRPRISSQYDFKDSDWYFQRNSNLPLDYFPRYRYGINPDRLVVIVCAIAAVIALVWFV